MKLFLFFFIPIKSFHHYKLEHLKLRDRVKGGGCTVGKMLIFPAKSFAKHDIFFSTREGEKINTQTKMISLTT